MYPGVFKNIFANWMGLIVTALVGFFLMPFVLHHLGNSGFGLWVLASTFTGYYGILDFGLRSAATRYVARYAAIAEWDELSNVVNTTLIAYSVLALLMLLASAVVALRFELFFHVSPEWQHVAKLLILVFGGGTAVSVPIGVFSAVLEALQKFIWVSTVQVISSILRAGLVVFFLSQGHGLLALAVISVVLNVGGYLAYMFLSFRTCPQLRLGLNYPRWATFKELAAFGAIVFWIAISAQLRFQTDSLVIGSMLTVEAIAVFSIGSKLVAYATDAVQATAMVFTPMASHFDARQELQQLQRVLIMGNRYSSFVMFPIAAILVVLGKTLIRVWVGPAYLESYPVLVILVLSTTLYLAQAASPKVLYGMAQHQALAGVFFAEGIANVVLSILLARHMGINGVALGTAIPMACTSILFLPCHLCRKLRLRTADYLRRTYTYPILLNALIIPVLWAADRWIAAKSYPELLLEVGIAGAAYGAAITVYYYCKERPEINRSEARRASIVASAQ
jgi:O-antigen/teichoic acid export membrane protein